MITLEPIDRKNVWKVAKLTVKPEQTGFVASNTESLLEAYATRAEGLTALPFAICREHEPVGFVMFGYGTLGEEGEPSVAAGNYCLWRLMIDQAYQGQGYGREALQAALTYLRTQPCGPGALCWLSYEPENTGAKALYSAFGFRENGETDGDELVAVRPL